MIKQNESELALIRLIIEQTCGHMLHPWQHVYQFELRTMFSTHVRSIINRIIVLILDMANNIIKFPLYFISPSSTKMAIWNR